MKGPFNIKFLLFLSFSKGGVYACDATAILSFIQSSIKFQTPPP